MVKIIKGFPTPKRVKGLARGLLDETTEEGGVDFESGRSVLISKEGEPLYGWRGDDSEAEEAVRKQEEKG